MKTQLIHLHFYLQPISGMQWPVFNKKLAFIAIITRKKTKNVSRLSK
jgi:hypothetical protein